MMRSHVPALWNQALIGVSLFVVGIWLAREIGYKIVIGDMRQIIFTALAFAACAVAVAILRNWRTGFYLFLVWMIFEDLVRKYMGNDTALFFGKDILLGFVYFALYIEIRRGREKSFRPPFLLFLSLFFWLGVLQTFNQNSPSIWYGLLGLKVYFYYTPLVFVGYALVRSDEDLRKFLVANAALAGIVGAIGVTQAIVGNTFMNPVHLSPELEELGNLYKTAPISGQVFSLPDSVFVSSGRYSEYLTLSFIMAMGTAGYLLLYTKRSRSLVFLVIGLAGVAAFLSGNRGCFMYVLATGLMLPIAFFWGAPWRAGQVRRILKAVRRATIVAALGLLVMFSLFPLEAASRLAFYAETLLPGSTEYQVANRAWDYPVQNFLTVFTQPNWGMGNGIGTASLGTQYVARLSGRPAPSIGVEEGYGTLMVEMGVIGPLLWILWTAALLYYSWRTVRSLRETRLFPIAFAIFWYALLLLFPWTYASVAPYQNYTCNAFLWLLVGVLFRLPELLRISGSPMAVPVIQRLNSLGLQF